MTKPTRRLDGKPETPADTRFFDARESGYRGPLDSDGRRVTDPRGLHVMARLDQATSEQIRSGQQ